MTLKRTIAPEFRLLLTGEATVTALTGTRIYFARLPQQPTYPAITLELVDRNPHNALASWPALVWSKVRVRSWGETYAAATELAQVAQRAINGIKATVAGHTYIRSIVAGGMQDDYSPEVEAYGIQQDYRIWHYYEPTVPILTAEDLTAEAFLSPTGLTQTQLLTTEDLTAQAFLEAGIVVVFRYEATFTTAVLADTEMVPQPEDEVAFTTAIYDDGAPP